MKQAKNRTIHKIRTNFSQLAFQSQIIYHQYRLQSFEYKKALLQNINYFCQRKNEKCQKQTILKLPKTA